MTDDKTPTQFSSPQRVTTREALRSAVDKARREGKKIGLVPTMGALHEGHLSLIDACRAECDFTVVTIFVNPTQFGEGEDLGTYPRSPEEDARKLGEHTVDLVYMPAAGDVYHEQHATYVEIGPLGEILEGASRPGHFRGVATVVLKLFHQVGADIAYFGQKDYQQTLVVRQMVRDFDLPIEIRVCPIVREEDGLAMSSRNRYLSAGERQQAVSLYEGLCLAARRVDEGTRDAKIIADQVSRHLQLSGAEVEYVAILGEGTARPVTQVEGPIVVAIAARVGKTRLLDNRVIR